MDLATVNRYFQEHIPMMRNPIAEHMVEKVRNYVKSEQVTSPEKEIAIEYTGSIAEDLYICSKVPDIDCLVYVQKNFLELKPPSLKYLDNKPGFVWYIVDDEDKKVLSEWFEDEHAVFEATENGKTFSCLNPNKFWRSGKIQSFVKQLASELSSKTIMTVDLNISGPTYTFESKVSELQDVFTAKGEMDYVCAFQLQEWPSFLRKNWINRNYETWPSRATAARILSSGLGLVPKSSPNGNSNLEWRLSFSLAEMALTMDLTSSQKITYKYLKFLATEEFNNPKILHTYHLKTVFFWTLQELPPEKKWENALIGERLLDLFYYLIKCLKVGIIPNFFVPQMNILESISREKLDTVLANVLNTMPKIQNPYNQLLSGRSWIEIYHKGINFTFTENAKHRYFTEDNNRKQSWKYFTYIIWSRYLRKNKDKKNDIPLIEEKLRTDPDIDYLEICLKKCSCSRGNRLYSPYALLKYILNDNRTESLALFRKEVTEVAEQEFDLVMGTLRFDWDVYKVFY